MKTYNLLNYTPTIFYFCRSAKNEFAYNVDQAVDALSGSGNAAFQCTLCGAHFKTGIVAESIVGGESITLGMDCAETMELAQIVADSTGEIEVLRAQAMREKNANRIKLFSSRHPGIVEFLDDNQDRGEFFVSLRDSLDKFGELTGGQVGALEKIKARREAEATENKIAAPSGRVAFSGVVVGIKPPPENAMYPTFKMILKIQKDNDVWLTMGSIGKQLDGVERGDKVDMTATLKAGRDPSFVFYSRPSKVTINQPR